MEFIKTQRSSHKSWVKPVSPCEVMETFRGLHRDERMSMHFTLQGENQLFVAK